MQTEKPKIQNPKSKIVLLGLISAAVLAFQVVLTRFFALAQGHHFAFMAISLALLGAGASGTYLSLRPPTVRGLQRLLTTGAICFTLSVPTAFLVINTLPFDAYRIAWERIQLLWLVLYYLALTVPFFFAGLVVGAVLATRPGQAGAIYAANLLGSGLGPPLALLALAIVGGEGTLFLVVLLGLLAVLISLYSPQTAQSSRQGQASRSRLRFIRYSLIPLVVVVLYLAFYPPAVFTIRLTPYKPLSQATLYPGSEVIFRQWNAFSRVDVVRSQGIRSAPGLSFTYAGNLPPQLGLLVDGDNLSPITNLSPTEPTFTPYLPLALAFELRPAARVLILEPGGGLAVLTALQNGARSVTVVQSNHTVVNAVGHHFAEFNRHLYDDPRLSLVIDEPRSFLRRTGETFDLIIFPLTDSFRSVTAGAYTLSEDYRYTIETFSDALTRLSPRGLLVVERWLQLPPSESLRLWGTAAAAMRASLEGADPAGHLLALRSLQTSFIAAARSPLSGPELAIARQFAAERQFDLVWLPGIDPAEVNRFSIVPQADYYQTFSRLLAAPNPDTFFATYAYAVAPPGDDHPFFFHFFKWQQIPQILQSLGKTWQPFGGSGYLVLVVLLALVLSLSALLILSPLFFTIGERQRSNVVRQKYPPGKGRVTTARRGALVRYLLYFTFLGLGFLFIEIPLLQRFILYLGQPVYSFAVVVSALLIASGLGSGYLSGRLPLPGTLFSIAALTIVYPLLLPKLFEVTLFFPFTGRVIVTVLVLFPLGMLMGVPFPRGLALVEQQLPGLTPWVWAVNGCASVVSAVLASLVALTWGFSAVLWGAALVYSLASVVIGIDKPLRPIPQPG